METRAALAGVVSVALLLLAACGGSNGSSTTSTSSSSSSQPGSSSQPTSATPTATLTASATAVASGSSATLTWSSTNATSCTASGGWSGTLSSSGSQSTGALTSAKTYSLTCSGSGGTSSAASVTVNISPTATLSANPTVVSSGGTSVLTWSSGNATACTASGGWSGTLATSGTQTTSALSATTSYSLVCSGAGGTSSMATATVVVASGTVSVSPGTSAITSSQTLQFTASVPGGASAIWSVDGVANGNASVGTVTSGGLYTGGTAGGVHTVTATSAANASQSGSATVAVTALAGVYTYHNDVARDGVNQQEYALTPTTVGSGNFHKLFSCNVDGAIYGQPLWVANTTVGGAKHNVVIVATAHDSLYAFDADASPCVTLWSASLIDTGHGAGAGETTVPAGTSGNLVGTGYGDMTPEVGITGTPVIDPTTNTLYAVSKSVLVGSPNTFYQRLHAIDITTGSERTSSPKLIAASVSGTGSGGSTVTFNPQTQFQRAGLALANGTVYVLYASHEDTAPYFGWALGYTYSSTSGFTQASVLNVAPNDTSGNAGGIWMAGGAPALDSSGNLYFLTGNGAFNATSSNYGDSLLKVSSALGIQAYFTPSDQAWEQSNDKDFGSGGTAVLADLPAGSAYTHLLLGGGKDGSLFVLNRDTLGSADGGGATTTSGSSNCAATTVSVQCASLGHGIFSTGAFWNNTFYIAPGGGNVTAYALTTSTAQFNPATTSAQTFGWPGATPSVSASGAQGGIVWVVNTNAYCTHQSSSCGPAVLYAYDATNLATLLWTSSTTSGDVAGNAVKFAVPTIANGKVYVGTRGSNSGAAYVSTCSGSSATNACGELDVYGLSN